MIQTQDLVTNVLFGNAEKATIAVTAKKGTLTLQMLANEKQIGDKLKDSDIQSLPKVEMEFFNIKSIDALIGALECIKKNYTPPPSWSDQLALAC